jgi:hypothetical protein
MPRQSHQLLKNLDHDQTRHFCIRRVVAFIHEATNNTLKKVEILKSRQSKKGINLWGSQNFLNFLMYFLPTILPCSGRYSAQRKKLCEPQRL